MIERATKYIYEDRLKISEVEKYNEGFSYNNDGDVTSDEGVSIQRAIKYCFENGIKILEFDIPNQTYIVNTEICVYGSDLTIYGNGCKLRRTEPFIPSSTDEKKRIFGALFNVYGPSDGLRYNGDIYYGSTTPAQNIHVQDLHIVFVPKVTKCKIEPEKFTNGFAVCNANCVTLQNCTAYGAPQSDFSVVSSGHNSQGQQVNVLNVTLDGCTGTNSRKHTFRLNAADGSSYFTAQMVNCKGLNVIEEGIHLQCNNTSREKSAPGPFYFEVRNFEHDNTGKVDITGHCIVHGL